MKKPKVIYPSEAEIQKQIIDYLNFKGYFFWRNNVGRKHNLFFGLKGSADLEGITHNGIFFAIEVKDHKGKQTADQKMFEDKVNANNGIYVLARDVEHIVDIL